MVGVASCCRYSSKGGLTQLFQKRSWKEDLLCSSQKSGSQVCIGVIQTSVHSCHQGVSSTMHVRRASVASLSHLWITMLALHFITLIAVCSHLHIGRWPTSFPHREKILCCVITLGIPFYLASSIPQNPVFRLQTEQVSPVC